MNKIVGIMGGMGPLASVDLQLRIIQNTLAEKDQDHLHVITDSNSQIPDRTAAILHGGEDPLPEMIKSAQRLENAGAKVLVMACHTAHYYFNEIQKSVSVPLINMVELATDEAKKRQAKNVVIFSTTGTQVTGLYEKSCRLKGMEVMELTEEENKLLMRIIYGVKAGEMDHEVEEMRALLALKKRDGADIVFLACTELPLYFQRHDFEGSFIDPTFVLARELIRMAGGKLKSICP